MGNRTNDSRGRPLRNLPSRDRGPSRRKAALRSHVRALQKGIQKLMVAVAGLRRAAARLDADAQEGYVELPDKAAQPYTLGSPTSPQAPTPVVTIETKLRGDRRFDVIINRKPAFTLSHTLGTVLSILHAGAMKVPNGPAPWLSYALISAQVAGAATQARPPSKRVVANYVYRLRAALADHGFDPAIVERAPRLGARLVLPSQPPHPPSAAAIGPQNAPPAQRHTQQFEGRKETP